MVGGPADDNSESREAVAAREGALAAGAWTNASPWGLAVVGVVLCIVAAVRLVCGSTFFQASSAIRAGATFQATTQTAQKTAANPQKPLRWCVCDKQWDPLGRTGKVGLMLTDEFCDACYSATEMAEYRQRLVRNGGVFPWLLGILSVLLIVLAVAPVLRNRCPSIHQKVYYLTGLLNLADMVVNLVSLLLWSDAEVFKSLCFQGHVFDTTYGVETSLPNDTYSEVCAYSSREYNMEKALLGLVYLDIFVFVILAFMQTLREQGFINRIVRERRKVLSSFIARALPVPAFDSRPGMGGSQAVAQNDRRHRTTFRSRFESNRGVRAAKHAFGVDLSLGRLGGRTCKRGHESTSGLLSVRHDGRGQRSGRLSRTYDQLPEAATHPADVSMAIDEHSEISDSSDDAGRNVFDALPLAANATRDKDIELELDLQSNGDEEARELADHSRLDPVLLGRRRQLPTAPGALPSTPPHSPGLCRQLPTVPNALPSTPPHSPGLHIPAALPSMPTALPPTALFPEPAALCPAPPTELPNPRLRGNTLPPAPMSVS